uniref:SUEL-type lectin domain-containing protein n=1 Tax=Macrostomum lignano TaxID=282301 RepID=A0A1I8HHY7_9PLAT
ILSGRCAGRSECRLSSDPQGLPCHGLQPFLSLTYVCQPALQSLLLCSGNQRTIRCPAGHRVVVAHARLTRKYQLNGGEATCPDLPRPARIVRPDDSNRPDRGGPARPWQDSTGGNRDLQIVNDQWRPAKQSNGQSEADGSHGNQAESSGSGGTRSRGRANSDQEADESESSSCY